MANLRVTFTANGVSFDLVLSFAGAATSGTVTGISGTAAGQAVTGLVNYNSTTQTFDGAPYTTFDDVSFQASGISYNFYGNAGSVLLTSNDGAFSNTPTSNITTSAADAPPNVDVNVGSTVAESGNDTITAAELHSDDAEQPDTQITYTVTTATANGTLLNNGSALGVGGTFTQDDINNNRVTYSHNGGETTSDSFGFSVSDGQNAPLSGLSFALTVTPVNDGPAATNLSAPLVYTEETTAQLTDIVVSDADSATVTATLQLNDPAAGALTTSGGGTFDAESGLWSISGSVVAVNAALAAVAFVPALNYDGAFTITTSVSDGVAAPVTGTINVTGTGVDDAPVAQNDAFTTTEALGVLGSLFANNGSGVDVDVDGPALTVASVDGSAADVGTPITLDSGALLTVNPDGTFDYDPNDVFNALPDAASGGSDLTETDSFTYTLAGGGTATVTITIGGVDSDDLISGSGAANLLNGGVGDDTIFGFGGKDTLQGGMGKDSMVGGLGDDFYYVGRPDDIVVEVAGAGQGRDTVATSGDYTLGDGVSVEVLRTTGASLTSPLKLVGNDFGQEIIGNAGDNTLDGQGGVDVLRGGRGDDLYYVDAAGDSVFEASGGGADTVAARGDYVLAAGSHVETLRAISNGGTTAIDLTGNEFANTLLGNAGNNRLIGGGGADVLKGLEGADTLNGGSGADALFGGDGADSFNVTATLNGAVDTVMDFGSADRFTLGRAAFAALSTGALYAEAFALGPIALETDDRIVYDQATGNLFYDADGLGGSSQVLFANLENRAALSAADFTVV